MIGPLNENWETIDLDTFDGDILDLNLETVLLDVRCREYVESILSDENRDAWAI